jgi:hypothetical protein
MGPAPRHSLAGLSRKVRWRSLTTVKSRCRAAFLRAHRRSASAHSCTPDRPQKRHHRFHRACGVILGLCGQTCQQQHGQKNDACESTFHTALLFHFADTFNDVHHSPHIRLDVFFKIRRVLIQDGAATVLNHLAHLVILCGHSRCGAQALCHGVWRAAGDKQARPMSSVKLRG